MSKRPRPTTIEKIQAKQAPVVAINPGDIQNVVFGARVALRYLVGADFDNVSRSISAIDAAFAPKEPQPTPTPEAKG